MTVHLGSEGHAEHSWNGGGANALIPPAIVFPPFGKPLFNDTGPLPLAGAGLPWPGSSNQVKPEAKRSARVPLAHVWESLFSDDRVVSIGPPQVLAEEALAIAARAALDRDGVRASQRKPKACVVIPNELPEARQQGLIDACKSKGIDVVLLWRPVAAAFEWLKMHGHKHLRSVDRETTLGSLLSIHLSSDGFEGTWLELILRPDSGSWIRPARKRPLISCTSVAAGRHCLQRAVSIACRDATGDNRHLSEWRALWASPATRRLLAGHGEGPSSAFWGVMDGFEGRMLSAMQQAAMESTAANKFGGQEDGWLGHLHQLQAGHNHVIGAIVTGDLARTMIAGQSLGQVVVRRLLPNQQAKIEVEGADGLTPGVLARGAATFAKRRSQGMPTYLDTLPKLEVLLEERAEPIWRSLLQEGEQYVDGGRAWRREPDLDGLSIPAGAKELALSVLVEPEKFVRRVRFSLPDPPLQKEPVRLRAEMEPAGGRARVSLLPDDPKFLRRREVMLEWARAEVLDQDREAAKDQYPRKCPRIQPRRAWQGGWYVLQPALWPLLKHGAEELRSSLVSRPQTLTNVREALNSPPNFQSVGSSGIGIQRVVCSEGKLNEQQQNHQSTLDSFTRVVAEASLIIRREGRPMPGPMLAVLGYACATGEAVDELVDLVLRQASQKLDANQAIFLSGCARAPAQCSTFIGHLLREMESGWSGFNELLKVVGYMLQWRDYALTEVSTETALGLINQACQLIALAADPRLIVGEVPNIKRPGIWFIERNSLVLIAYLLRKRIDHDQFLPPDGNRALWLKKVLESAYRGIESGKLQTKGGMVNASLLLRNVIEYVDREGTGAVIAD